MRILRRKLPWNLKKRKYNTRNLIDLFGGIYRRSRLYYIAWSGRRRGRTRDVDIFK
jgi:hypothetical protein